jgi:hypothetical protein
LTYPKDPHDYINNFLYFTFRPYEGGDESTLIYCSGVNVDLFYPITKGRHRPMSNPVIRGLQLVNLGVRALALKAGAKPVSIKGDHCAGIVPQKDGWYKENLLIERAPDTLPEKITDYCVVELMKKIDKAIILGAEMPDKPMEPDELQVFLESLCRKYGG